MNVKTWLLVAVIALMTACSTTLDDKHNFIYVADNEWARFIEDVNCPHPPEEESKCTYYRKNYDKAIADQDTTTAKEERRRIVMRFIQGIDAFYDRNVKALLLHGKAKYDTATEIAVLALTGGAAISDGGTTKTLAAISTLIQGGKMAVDKNIFQDNSPTILIIKMEQLRTERLVEIKKSLMSKEIQEYPLDEALHDVIKYYDAGTLKGALIATVQDSAIKKEVAEENLRKLNNVEYRRTNEKKEAEHQLEQEKIKAETLKLRQQNEKLSAIKKPSSE